MSAAATPATIESAVAALRAELAGNPGDPGLCFDLAQLLLSQADAIAADADVRLPGEVDEAVELLRRTVTLAADHPAADRAVAAVELARVLCWRCGVAGHGTGVTADAGEAVDSWCRAVEFADEAGFGDELLGQELAVALDVIELMLGEAAAGDTAGLDTAIHHGTRIEAHTPADHQDRRQLLYLLGMAHLLRHDYTEGAWPQDQDRVIDCLTELRALLADDDPGTGEVALWLGMALACRALTTGGTSEPELAAAAQQLDLALQTLPDLEPDLLMLAKHRRGVAHAFRVFSHGAGQDVRQAALADLAAVVEAGCGDHTADGCHLMMAQLELTRSWPGGAFPSTLEEFTELPPQAVEDAMGHFAALSAGPANPAFGGADTFARIAARLPELAESSSVDAIDAVLDLIDTAGKLDQEAGGLVALLRAGLEARKAEFTGEEEAAAQAVDLLDAALGQLPTDHLLQLAAKGTLDKLAALYGHIQRDDEDTAAVVARLERQLGELPPEHPDRPTAVARLASTLLKCALYTGSSDALHRSRTLLSSLDDQPLKANERVVQQHYLALADSVNAYLKQDPKLVGLALERMQTASTLMPPGHPMQDVLGSGAAALLGQRYTITGERDVLDAARYFLRRREPATDHPVAREEGPFGWVPGATRGLEELGRAWSRLADFGNMPAPAEMEQLDHSLQAMRDAGFDRRLDVDVGAMQQLLRTYRSTWKPDGADFPTDPAKAAEFTENALLLESMLSATPTGRLDRTSNRAAAALAAFGAGFVGRDEAAFQRGLRQLAEVCDERQMPDRDRFQCLSALGMGLLMRHRRYHRRSDLNDAIGRLEQAVGLVELVPDLGDSAATYWMLGDACSSRADQNLGDLRRAATAGLEGLRRRTDEVLLQSGAAHGLSAARSAAGEAVEVARWCLRSGRSHEAVTALELGRGMVLHAATAEASVPTLLREAGHTELADRWQQAPRTRPWDDDAQAAPPNLADAQLPDDLRLRGLEAIRSSPTIVGRLSPPSVGDIAGSLHDAAVAALVYLLPATYAMPGTALLVTPAADVEQVPLPQLNAMTRHRLTAFKAAQRAVQEAPDLRSRGALLARWRQDLDALCGWAWNAAMRPMLDHLGGFDRARRLVLVPVGELGTVPWHAAVRQVGRGVPRYACQDAIISYAASARQFVDAGRGGRLPWAQSAALVRVGESRLASADRELAVIGRRCYPGGTLLGQDGPVGADAVLALLPADDRPGASVLHLSCHAEHAAVPIESALLLDGEVRLHVRDMLGQARHRAVGAPGGLVTLATCVSDLTDEAQDEALTLTTAFLAAGASGVVGTRWPVADRPTALFMIMFHHYLNAGYGEPAVALRAAQRWMLNPHRELPPGFDDELARAARRADLGAACHWAGFTYQGS